ncbi:MAG: N-acetylmuramoyl-L-alanine amidase [Planctomycetes bacterium]|nr:N-acetylmuramoyl-L-alanine amidase [Planctomycetota bacterium]
MGRLQEVQQEVRRGGASSQSALQASRVRNARTALEKIAHEDSADESQQKRAQDSLASADTLLAQLGQSRKTTGVPVIARAQWGAAPARAALMIKNSGGWKKITVHHSAEADPTPLDGSAASSAAALRQIQRSHLKGKTPPWGDIGYHYLIDPEGRVFQGRDLAWQGAHAKGDNNIQNIGICLLGNFDEEKPTQAALDSLRKLLDDLRRTYRIPRSEVHKHADFRSTDCPGKFLKPWVEAYRKGSGSDSAAHAN